MDVDSLSKWLQVGATLVAIIGGVAGGVIWIWNRLPPPAPTSGPPKSSQGRRARGGNSLAAEVQRDACAGRLPKPLTAQLIRATYAHRGRPAYLTVLLPNNAEGGDYVNRGQPARFRRIGNGEYEAICAPARES